MIKSWFRMVGWLEALSIVALMGVAMPMKYWFEMPGATKVPGLIHGLLFLGYVGLASLLAQRENWPRRKLLYAYLASVAPMGTLVFDRKFLKD